MSSSSLQRSRKAESRSRRFCSAGVKGRCELRGRLRPNVAQVAVPVFGVEGSEALKLQDLVDLGESTEPLAPLVERVPRVQEVVNQAAEQLRRPMWPVVRLVEHLLENVGHPTMSGAAIMSPVGPEVGSALRRPPLRPRPAKAGQRRKCRRPLL